METALGATATPEAQSAVATEAASESTDGNISNTPEQKPERKAYLDQVKPEYRDNEYLNSFSGVNEMAEKLLEYQSKSEPVYFSPDMDEAAMQKYREAAGIPSDPKEYGEGVAAEVFIKAGINPAQAKILMEASEAANTEAAQRAKAEHAEKIRNEGKQVMEKLQKEFGQNWEGKQIQLRKGLNFLSPDVQKFLSTSELGNNEALLRDLIKIGEKLGEGRMIDKAHAKMSETGDAWSFDD